MNTLFTKDEKKRIVFITGTRADYGKIKPLLKAVENNGTLELFIYVSGMHLVEQYGMTAEEVYKDGYKNIFPAFGQVMTSSMSYNLGDIICNLTGYIERVKPDMIVVHGDRIEALAGAIVGAMNNVLVAHIEGGEITGTIDESIRHAVSKFSHLHFVANDLAKNTLIQLGEKEENIYVIGSPDIDVMKNENLPSIEKAKEWYEIGFDKYSILMYHPVTTEIREIKKHIEQVTEALVESGKNYIVILPNNDSGTEIIQQAYRELAKDKFKIFPSTRFEYFLTLLKNADCMIGNSSAGIREAGFYGVPVIDIGTRQKGRYSLADNPNIQWVPEDKSMILSALADIDNKRCVVKAFGDGHSTERFMDTICKPETWTTPIQKKMVVI